jgi:phosphoenolpyruvate-protein kinase (PTS system EI component)
VALTDVGGNKTGNKTEAPPFGGATVIIRTLDLGSNKIIKYPGATKNKCIHCQDDTIG